MRLAWLFVELGVGPGGYKAGSHPVLPCVLENLDAGILGTNQLCIHLSVVLSWALLKAHFDLGEGISFAVLRLGVL